MPKRPDFLEGWYLLDEKPISISNGRKLLVNHNNFYVAYDLCVDAISLKFLTYHLVVSVVG